MAGNDSCVGCGCGMDGNAGIVAGVVGRTGTPPTGGIDGSVVD
jgi:hypothetical protein